MITYYNKQRTNRPPAQRHRADGSQPGSRMASPSAVILRGISRSSHPFPSGILACLHDYDGCYRGDSAFTCGQNWAGADGVSLDFFGRYQQADGASHEEYAVLEPFVDWANGKDWSVGSPPTGADGSSDHSMTSNSSWAYQWAAEMEAGLGIKSATRDAYQRAKPRN